MKLPMRDEAEMSTKEALHAELAGAAMRLDRVATDALAEKDDETAGLALVMSKRLQIVAEDFEERVLLVRPRTAVPEPKKRGRPRKPKAEQTTIPGAGVNGAAAEASS